MISLLTDLRCPIETTDQVLGYLTLRRIRCRAEIAQLEHQLGLVDQNVIRLDIRVQDLTLLEQLEGPEQLTGIGPNSRDVQAHIFPVLLQHLSQVHAERLENDAQMLLVVECLQQAQTVELVLRVGLLQLAQILELLDTALVGDVVVADDFDDHFGVLVVQIAGSDHVGEDTLASVAVN